MIDPGTVTFSFVDATSAAIVGDHTFTVPNDHFRHYLALCERLDLQSGIVVREPGHVRLVVAAHRAGWMRGRVLLQIHLSDHALWGLPPSEEAYRAYLGLVPDDIPFTWMSYTNGPSHWAMTEVALRAGAHVHVGIGDTARTDDGGTPTNVELVERAIARAALHGRRPATPSEALELLGTSGVTRTTGVDAGPAVGWGHVPEHHRTPRSRATCNPGGDRRRGDAVRPQGDGDHQADGRHPRRAPRHRRRDRRPRGGAPRPGAAATPASEERAAAASPGGAGTRRPRTAPGLSRRSTRPMKLLGVSGSLDAGSANTALLETMARALDGPTTLHVFAGIDALPHFSTDRDRGPLDPAVEEWRAAVGAADAVVIATPEYAGGMPGALKNALDWLVSSGELYEKPAIILSAAPAEERGGRARDGLDVTLTMQGARVRDSFTVVVGRQRTDAALAAAAAATASRLVGALTSGP